MADKLGYRLTKSLRPQARPEEKETKRTKFALGRPDAETQIEGITRPSVRGALPGKTESEEDIVASMKDYLASIKADNEALLGSIEKEQAAAERQRPMGRAESSASVDLPTRELLAKTIEAEAGKESYEGKLAVGAVIANRVNSENYGNSFQEVILAPGQFSAWNSVTGYAKGEGGLNMDLMKPSKESYAIADAILKGSYESPVGDATHYYNPDVATPNWGRTAGGDWQEIGNHIFGYANKG